MFYLITYDIINDKRRTKLSTLLEKYGTRVNYSVFECELTQRKLDKLLAEIELKKLLHKEHDSLRFYHVCKNCAPKCFEVTNRLDPFESEEMYI